MEDTWAWKLHHSHRYTVSIAYHRLIEEVDDESHNNRHLIDSQLLGLKVDSLKMALFIRRLLLN